MNNYITNPGFPSGEIRTIQQSPIFKPRLVQVALVFFAIAGTISLSKAQTIEQDEPGVQVLTRGPVHEAFAGIVSYEPEEGVVVTKSPPALIEELPPEERPDGEDVTWIPGYWGWDDERNNFLWISGTWRALPPDREWIAGYWGKVSKGYQWTSGYWADSTERETTYLPTPPDSLEEGPNIAAPSDDYSWTPGYWVWRQERYAWRPGVWEEGREDWDWIPAHYVWTPRGYVFNSGYWDYPVERRGVLFAPVYFDAGYSSRRSYSYSPRIVINVGVFNDHLFLRPSYQHYYFGDYYARNYSSSGFIASFTYQSSRRGYDPFYSRQRWENRQDHNWRNRVVASHQYRRDNVNARPARTWVVLKNSNQNREEFRQNRLLVATPLARLVSQNDGALRFRTVAQSERQQLATRNRKMQEFRDRRRTLEATSQNSNSQRAERANKAETAKLPPSQIIAKSGNTPERNRTRTQAQVSTSAETNSKRRTDLNRKQEDEKRNVSVQQQERSDSENKLESERNRKEQVKQDAQRKSDNAQQKVREERIQTQSERKPRDQEAWMNSPEDWKRTNRELEKPAKQQSREEQIVVDAQKRTSELQRTTRESQKVTQQKPQPRLSENAAKTQESSQSARRLEEKNRQPSESRNPVEKNASPVKQPNEKPKNQQEGKAEGGEGKRKQSDQKVKKNKNKNEPAAPATPPVIEPTPTPVSS